MKKIFIALVAAMAVSGCTDAGYEKFAAYGNRANVKCYSGGVLIYEGTSTGKLRETTDSDGYNLKDSKLGTLVQVTGDCVVVYLK